MNDEIKKWPIKLLPGFMLEVCKDANQQIMILNLRGD